MWHVGRMASCGRRHHSRSTTIQCAASPNATTNNRGFSYDDRRPPLTQEGHVERARRGADGRRTDKGRDVMKKNLVAARIRDAQTRVKRFGSVNGGCKSLTATSLIA